MSDEDSNNSMMTGLQQALVADREVHPALKGLGRMTIARQIGLMLGLALSVAIGVAVVLWSQTPSYSRLYSEISEQDVSDIIEYLDTQDIKYKVEPGTGAIMVPPDKVSEIKLKLAGQGLPRSNSQGYELLDKEQAIGASKSVELMRFQRALEGEIAQTIMAIQSVKSARVLLALPVQSVFIRERKKPSASVIVNLYQGRSLDKGQIESIIHLVASSVPQLEAEQVTVVDQKGRLLNSKDTSLGYLTAKQFDYKKDIEEHLMERIANILSPLVGDGMRTQISADVDFTETDKTQENFDPKSTVLRSEQSSEEQNTLPGVQGVPGALSNQPTAAGSAPETTATTPATPGQAGKPAAASNAGTLPSSSSKNATKNFEMDKTITHTRLATGQLHRLSVAVVVDDKHTVEADGKIKNQPHTQEDIDRFTELVKQAVGFDSARGDQVTVTNVAFKTPDALEALPEPPLWEQAWFITLMKQLAALLAVIFLIFGVLRPTMRRLVGRSEEEIKAELLAEKEAEKQALALDENGIPIATPSESAEGALPSPETMDMLLLDTPQTYETRLEYVKKLVDNDSKLVAEVLKSWIK
ncbi:MAG: flagellar basal-body MS-ring/collar protein FliF [Methylovulum sp.]|nr:flagellar basal-body MS-ring/collar protein FliF [Methylovulum sp.]